MRIQVKDFMLTQVVTAMGEDSVEHIRRLMKENEIHAIPIISYTNDTLKVDMTIRGIVTATDLSKDMDENTIVADVMTSSNLYVVHVDSGAQSVVKLMLRHKVHHIVVMDEDLIKGMISSLDFVKLLAQHSLE